MVVFLKVRLQYKFKGRRGKKTIETIVRIDLEFY